MRLVHEREAPRRHGAGVRRVSPDGSGPAEAVLSLQRLAGNLAVARALGKHAGTPPQVQRCAGHTCPPEGCERDTALIAQRDGVDVALTDAQAEQLARRPSLALTRWPQLGLDQRGVIGWKMAAAYGADFTLDFLAYANGAKKPNLSVTVSNSASLTPKVLAGQGYRLAGNPGGIELWVHPSGHEIQMLSRSGPAPAETECGDPNAGTDCLTDSDDEDSCRECCDSQYASDQPCRSTCRAGCANKL